MFKGTIKQIFDDFLARGEKQNENSAAKTETGEQPTETVDTDTPEVKDHAPEQTNTDGTEEKENNGKKGRGKK